jgi:hypothetical protein
MRTRVSNHPGCPVTMSTKGADSGADCQTGFSNHPSIAIGIGVRRAV